MSEWDHSYTLRSKCPKCDGLAYRSRVRWYERWRKMVSARRPFRCSRCERRTWMRVPDGDRLSDAAEAQIAPTTQLDLSAIDSAAAGTVQPPSA